MRLVPALLLALLAAPVAQAQDYPTRNVTFVVPTGPARAPTCSRASWRRA